jgi:hypothetical protein
MAPWGLRVSIIEPGAMKTAILGNPTEDMKSLWDTLSSDVQERWGVEFLTDSMKRLANDPMRNHPDNPMKVVRVIQHAVMNTNPHIRYRPGWQSKLTYFVFCITPDRLLDRLFSLKSKIVPASVQNQLMN